MNRRITVLQTGALPLGYRTILPDIDVTNSNFIIMSINDISLTYIYAAYNIYMTPTGIEPVLPP